MSIFNKNAKQINGPINIIRMEGEINNTKKVIYMFMDQHYELIEQTECENVFAKDIDTFLAENFSKLNDSDRIYDFFLELMPSNIKNVKYGFNFESELNYRDIYIAEVMKLFRKLFKYNPNKNKVSISKYFKNVRLHYMDVRDYFEGTYFQGIFDANTITNNMMSKQDIVYTDLEELMNILLNFKTYCEIIYSVIKSHRKNLLKPKKIVLVKYNEKNPKNVSNTPQQQKKIFTDNITYIIDKTFGRFKHKKIQQKLSKQLNILETYLADLISTCDYLLKEFKSIGDIITENNNKLIKQTHPIAEYSYGLGYEMLLKMLFFIKENIAILSNKSTYFFTRFMDVYFLRRFLDKDYITNAITYTGSHHSAVYIEILSKDFGFRITHYFYSKINNITKLNAKIKKLKAESYGEIFYPPLRSQCSDISNFPENFL
jgi:hypothetical protein